MDDGIIAGFMPTSFLIDMNEKYIAPEMEIYTVVVEKGFEGSDDGGFSAPGWG